jgi:hypothetical protein
MVTTFILSLVAAGTPAVPGDSVIIRDAWRPRDNVERLIVGQDSLRARDARPDTVINRPPRAATVTIRGSRAKVNIHDSWYSRDTVKRVFLRIRSARIPKVELHGDLHYSSPGGEPTMETLLRYPRVEHGHWEGTHLGFTNLLGSDSKRYRGEFELDWSNSFTLQFNLFDRAIAASRSGQRLLFTGLGLEYNRFYFARDITLRKVDGQLEAVPLADLGVTNARRSVFKSLYLTIPLLLEANDRLFGGYISAGVVGGARVHSKTKIVHDVNGHKKKIKQTNSYYMNPFKLDLTARVGFRGLSVWASRSLVPLFDTGKGPRVYPFTIGFGFDG